MDPISDMFIRIKNAQKAGHHTVQVLHSKFKYEVVKLLERENWVAKVERRGKRTKKSIEISLLYEEERLPKISRVRLLSKPSRRVYRPFRKISHSSHGGIIIVSTPKGVMSSWGAVKNKVGGQLVAELW